MKTSLSAFRASSLGRAGEVEGRTLNPEGPEQAANACLTPVDFHYNCAKRECKAGAANGAMVLDSEEKKDFWEVGMGGGCRTQWRFHVPKRPDTQTQTSSATAAFCVE
jgi:hypothetical protein